MSAENNQNLKLELMVSEDQYRCIGLSTLHLDEPSHKVLTALAVDSGMVFERDSGYFVKLYDEHKYNIELPESIQDELESFPSILENIFSVVLSSGFRMIEFDCDAQVYDSLKTFTA